LGDTRNESTAAEAEHRTGKVTRVALNLLCSRDTFRVGSQEDLVFATMSSNTALFSLLQAYSALKHPRTLSFPSHLSFHQVHHFILSSILFNPHLLQYPPSHTYQFSFWKWVIKHLEALLGDEAGELHTFAKFTNHFCIAG
jgi:hypothetical protein